MLLSSLELEQPDSMQDCVPFDFDIHLAILVGFSKKISDCNIAIGGGSGSVLAKMNCYKLTPSLLGFSGCS